jgi:hypothetical protein
MSSDRLTRIPRRSTKGKSADTRKGHHCRREFLLNRPIGAYSATYS